MIVQRSTTGAVTPFEAFFAGEFQRRLDAVADVPGIFASNLSLSSASWDRKAAFLLWDALGRPGERPADTLEALFG